MTNTTNYNIELLSSNQDQPDVTLNDAIVALDTAAAAAKAKADAAYALASAGGGGGGSADGRARQYHFNASSVPTEIVAQSVFFPGEEPQEVAVFDLTDAKTGDDITIFYEERPAVLQSVIVVRIPADFDQGSIRDVNTSGGAFFLATADSIGSAFYTEFSERLPGVTQARSGTTEFLVVSGTNSQGYKVVQVNTFRYLARKSILLGKTFEAPAVNDEWRFVVPDAFDVSALLSFQFPRSFHVYSDTPVQLGLQVYAYDSSTRQFSSLAGEATWTNDEFGWIDNATMDISSPLPFLFTDNGGHSFIPPNARLVLKVVGFPDGPPSYIEATATIALPLDYNS